MRRLVIALPLAPLCGSSVTNSRKPKTKQKQKPKANQTKATSRGKTKTKQTNH
jgi:hypothetical protein